QQGEDEFFFSSRRRHTRSKRDWSSDVCSSDLSAALGDDGILRGTINSNSLREVEQLSLDVLLDRRPIAKLLAQRLPSLATEANRSEERRVGKEWRAWLGAEV